MTQKLKIRKEDLVNLEPLTNTQADFFDSWNKYHVHVLHGSAGTGKTIVALYKALESVMNRSVYKRVIILRSAVPSRDIGALPGDEEEKSLVYQLPYDELCFTLFGRGDAYSRLKEDGKVEFSLTSYIRGITFDNSIILVDEIQNLNYQELYSVMTRVGEPSKIVFCGDFKQRDLRDSGFARFLGVVESMKNTNIITFTTDDIVRSDIVKEFIIADENYE